jgi:hypothetical protein
MPSATSLGRIRLGRLTGRSSFTPRSTPEPTTTSGCPITGTVRPKHTHTYISFLVERKLNSGKWRYLTSGNLGLRDKGAVTVAFYTQSIEKYRVRTSFRGDKDHLKDVSRWAYFRTTN